MIIPPPGDKHYTHSQSPASATWTINHNLGKKPSVDVYDSTGRKVQGGESHVNNNTIILTFSAAFGGFAYLN